MSTTLTTSYPPHKYQGCYEDAEGGTGGARLLDGPSFSRNASLTQQGCKQFCSTKSAKATLAPYKYFALEFGVDCRCGNAYKHTLVKKTCKTPCSGNNKQQCGGAGAVDVWVNSDYIDGSAGGGSTGGSGSKTPLGAGYPTTGTDRTPQLEHPPQWVGDGVDEPYWPADSKYWEGQGGNKPAPGGHHKPAPADKPKPSSGGYVVNSKPKPKPASGYKAAKPSGYRTNPTKKWLSRFNLW